MKVIVPLATLAALLVLILAGCPSGDEAPADGGQGKTPETTKPTTEVTLAVSGMT